MHRHVSTLERVVRGILSPSVSSGLHPCRQKLVTPNQSWQKGGRGHSIICSSASQTKLWNLSCFSPVFLLWSQRFIQNKGRAEGKKKNTSDTSIYLQVLNDFLINSATCCLLASSPCCSAFHSKSILAQQRELSGWNLPDVDSRAVIGSKNKTLRKNTELIWNPFS